MEYDEAMLARGERRCPVCYRLFKPTSRGNAPAHGLDRNYTHVDCRGSGKPLLSLEASRGGNRDAS